MESLKLAELNLINKLGGVVEEGEAETPEHIAAVGYVLSIRGNSDAQRVGINTHRQNFEEYMWSVDTEDLNRLFRESGLAVDDEDDSDEGNEKKDTEK